MTPDNTLAVGVNARVLAQPGRVYAVYLPSGGEVKLMLEPGRYNVRWYNPRSGGALQTGKVRTVNGPGSVSLGVPPVDTGKDWAALVTRSRS
jgi:hypothetical protein